MKNLEVRLIADEYVESIAGWLRSSHDGKFMALRRLCWALFQQLATS